MDLWTPRQSISTIQPCGPCFIRYHSDLRQVPDTQEVFLTPSSDVTYIVEILESVEEADPTQAIR